MTKDSIVRVTGPAGPVAAGWLFRHGYEHAAYVRLDWVAAKASADALLIPHACATRTLPIPCCRAATVCTKTAC